ncbi:exosortase C-terminal domain/associated protein EpsI [Niveibacterium sp. COAC-50]|uniref:exosortase C-terminal domain/associated protein EpsI n=1 Tax=Niveibacterium sp. COAC-50 TaxID=2729384 RepID=UPI001558278C|nr:exosortase C-terminal domain/associated protein EpsI [Niveibacterium sp. COAC-50]
MTAVASLIPRISLRTALAYSIVCVLAAVGAWVLTPHPVAVLNAQRLEDSVPRQFGDWSELPSPFTQVSLSTGDAPNIDQPYDQTLMRTYVNGKGQIVMLALAWGATQRQEVKVHRPDLCYVAQGHKVKRMSPMQFSAIVGTGGPITGTRMLTESPRGGEAVMYWIRIGNIYSESALTTRLHILSEGISGRIPDGILVRASVHVAREDDANAAWPLMESFLNELVSATPTEARKLMVR